MKRFIELTLYESQRKALIALEDILDVVEQNRCDGKLGKDSYIAFKTIKVYTTHTVTYECDYSCYEMLKHYLCDWKE